MALTSAALCCNGWRVLELLELLGHAAHHWLNNHSHFAAPQSEVPVDSLATMATNDVGMLESPEAHRMLGSPDRMLGSPEVDATFKCSAFINIQRVVGVHPKIAELLFSVLLLLFSSCGLHCVHVFVR